MIFIVGIVCENLYIRKIAINIHINIGRERGGRSRAGD